MPAFMKILFVLALATPIFANADTPCGEALKFPEFSYERYAVIQKQKAAQNGVILPQFTDPNAEREAQKTWEGVEAPERFKELLPEGVTLVSHSLRKADPGFVKTAATGDAVILRVKMPYKGRYYSTNVVVPTSALAGNKNRTDKWLVGPDAAACIDWGHGGGTKDTGEHTAFGPLNYFLKYGIAVIGQAQPWHSEGDRDFTDTPDEYLTEIRQEFLKKFVHPSVKKFGVGHSLGGLYADMQWRRLGKDSVYSGFVSLSGIPDDCPGCSPKQKMEAEKAREELQKLPEYQKRMATGDKALGIQLIKNSKISALSMFFTQFTEYAHDWNKIVPEENRLPILYIWGEGDFLYVGAEELVKKLRDLTNVQVVTYGPRLEYSGRVENMGHLIFDHWRPVDNSPVADSILRNYLALPDSAVKIEESFKEKVLKPYVHPYTFLSTQNNTSSALLIAGYYHSPEFKAYIDQLIRTNYKGNSKDFFFQFVQKDTPETFVLVREMIENVLGNKLPERKVFSDAAKENAVLLNLFKRYSNDLVTRVMYEGIQLRDYESRIIAPSPLDPEAKPRNPVNVIADRAKILDHIVKNIDSLEKQKKSKKINEEEYARRIENLLKESKITLKAPDGKRVGIEWTVESLKKQKATLYAVLARNYTYSGPREKEVKENVEQRVVLKEKITAVMTAKKKLAADLRALTDQLKNKESRFVEILENDKQLKENPDYRKVNELNIELQKQLAVNRKIDLETREANAAYLEQLYEQGAMNGQNLNNLPTWLTETYARYTVETQKYEQMKANIAVEIKKLSGLGELGIQWQSLHKEIWGEEGLVAQIQKIQKQITDREFEADKLRIQSEDLLERYVDHLVPGLFKMRTLSGRDMIHTPDDSGSKALQTLTQKIQAATMTILSDMPPVGATELY